MGIPDSFLSQYQNVRNRNLRKVTATAFSYEPHLVTKQKNFNLMPSGSGSSSYFHHYSTSPLSTQWRLGQIISLTSFHRSKAPSPGIPGRERVRTGE
ncbi:hypothetical protein AVEN_38825-1 [Araneus ventricosus]|uniref:Uncharacterized protein n=1 Tax=Araneus ventricosus TaxID=182803 RepID=A0A4Y2K0W3_ARAVE|nr:hypothetical protein AVEN_38825-1 [Araneus ventricosus]